MLIVTQRYRLNDERLIRAPGVAHFAKTNWRIAVPENMNPGEIIGLLLLLLNLLWTIFWSVVVRKQVLASKDDARVQDHDKRLTVLEISLDKLPNHIATQGDITHLHNRISSLGKEVNGVNVKLGEFNGTLQSVDKNLDLLNKSEFFQKKKEA